MQESRTEEGLKIAAEKLKRMLDSVFEDLDAWQRKFAAWA